MYNGSLRDYKIDGSRLPMPYIIWECVGFSWGGTTDRSFRPNDMKQYAKYAAKPTSWGEPNGIGYSGTIGPGQSAAARFHGLRQGGLRQTAARTHAPG